MVLHTMPNIFDHLKKVKEMFCTKQVNECWTYYFFHI